MGRLQDDIVSTAESFTKNFSDKGKFDYSFESLEAVEELLEEMSDFVVDDEETMYNVCTMVGSYVFEVARRNYGGEYFWISDEEQPILEAGRPDFAVSIKAWEKVRGRLEHGEEDNIPFYIAGYKEHVEKGMSQKGYTALIV